MKQFVQSNIQASFLLLSEQEKADFECIKAHYKILWHYGMSMEIIIDGIPVILEKEQIVCIGPECRVSIAGDSTWSSLVFNREFYCLELHDAEVACSGFLFYGTSYPLILKLQAEDTTKFTGMYQVMLDEFDNRDHIQGEMLRMLLKRFIITCTRLGRQQYFENGIEDDPYNEIRAYRMLVETNFRTQHQVSFYAVSLHKSPKTIAHLFNRYHKTTPLKVIHDRLIQEARSLLYYTDKSAKEITHELGFEEPAHFSRFFKKCLGISPLDFRAQARVRKPGENW